MAYEVSKLVLQASSTGYAPLKDMLSYMKGKKKMVRSLEDNLTKMIIELATFYSMKEKVDRRLDAVVSKEKNGEYDLLVKHIEIYHKRYDEFVDKYKGYCQDLPSFESNDVSSATKVIDAVQERRPTIMTRKFFKLATLSRKIKELLDDVSLVSGKMVLENVSRDRKVEPVQVKYDDIHLPSSTEYVDRILRYLGEDGCRSVGILGPIGVGKTTIMKELNNQLKHSSSPFPSPSFDIVIWVDYHKQHDAEDEAVEAIQDVIWGRLKLEGPKGNSIEENAEIISSFLWDRKYLLLIDQVSSTINLDKVGIHKNHKFGRVVLASGNRKLIKNMTDEQVEIKPLSDNDAIKLFLKVCGKVVDTRIKLIAENIVKSCGGLPLVIKLVAYHLKGQRNEEVWSDVKQCLQSETKANLRELGGVGHAYKLVYDKLEKSQKKCLLFVRLFPSDHKINKDYLVECWNAERFLELEVPGLRTARERGATTLAELTDPYLLENHSDMHVKMPKYLKKVVAEEEYPGENHRLSWTPQKVQPLTEETWKATRMMSLIGCKSKLPSNPRSDNISTLLMQCIKHDLVTLGDPFFDNMKKLLILDLHKAKIESLPTSISSLVSLRCLYLNGCSRLAELPPEVENLKKLEILDIRGTSVRSLPDEMSVMIDLRCLRISFGQMECNRSGKRKEMGVKIPLNTISRLQQLEELTIEAGCCNQAWNDIAEQIVTELACLEKLSTLYLHFPNVGILEKFVAESKSLRNTDTQWSTNTLRSFNISIGCCNRQLPNGLEISGTLVPERRLRFSTIDEEISSVEEVLRQTSSFELVGHSGVESLSDFNLRNAGTLKVCVVGRCKNMTSLVDSLKISEMQTEITEETECAPLQCLEKLHLFELQGLQSIWKGPFYAGSLANLKDITLSGCPELTTILNREQAKALSSLEYVKVENCSKVVEIIDEEVESDVLILNNVKTIELVDLPMLRRICKTESIKWRSLVNIAILSCNRLRGIHSSLSNAENLERVECETSWWIQLPEEQDDKILPCCRFIDVGQKTASGEGESSEEGRSDARKCNGRAMPCNENPLVSNTSLAGIIAAHQSTNTNAPASNEASSLPVERCSLTQVVG